MNSMNARNTKLKGKEWIILSTIPLAFFFLFNRFVGGMKNQIVHWNAHTWNQKLASCSKSAIVINLIWKTTFQAVHSYQMLKSSKLHSRSAKGISSSPARFHHSHPHASISNDGKSRRHQCCQTQFVSVRAYQSQLLHNASVQPQRWRWMKGSLSKEVIWFSPCSTKGT